MIGSALPLDKPLTTTIIEPNQGGAVEVGEECYSMGGRRVGDSVTDHASYVVGGCQLVINTNVGAVGVGRFWKQKGP